MFRDRVGKSSGLVADATQGDRGSPERKVIPGARPAWPASRAPGRTDRSTGYEPKAIVLGGRELKSSYFFFSC